MSLLAVSRLRDAGFTCLDQSAAWRKNYCAKAGSVPCFPDSKGPEWTSGLKMSWSLLSPNLIRNPPKSRYRDGVKGLHGVV